MNWYRCAQRLVDMTRPDRPQDDWNNYFSIGHYNYWKKGKRPEGFVYDEERMWFYWENTNKERIFTVKDSGIAHPVFSENSGRILEEEAEGGLMLARGRCQITTSFPNGLCSLVIENHDVEREEIVREIYKNWPKAEIRMF